MYAIRSYYDLKDYAVVLFLQLLPRHNKLLPHRKTIRSDVMRHWHSRDILNAVQLRFDLPTLRIQLG